LTRVGLVVSLSFVAIALSIRAIRGFPSDSDESTGGWESDDEIASVKGTPQCPRKRRALTFFV
jgi:hypothetical protein